MTDESRKHSFGPQNQSEGVWDKYIGKYIFVHNPGNMKNCSGQLVEIRDGCYGVLSPFMGGHFDGQGDFERILQEEGEETVPLPGAVIEPTSRENVENYVKYSNKRDEKDKKTNGNIITP